MKHTKKMRSLTVVFLCSFRLYKRNLAKKNRMDARILISIKRVMIILVVTINCKIVMRKINNRVSNILIPEYSSGLKRNSLKISFRFKKFPPYELNLLKLRLMLLGVTIFL